MSPGGCLYCPPGARRCDVCDPPRAKGKIRLSESMSATQRRHARRGLHPMGEALAAGEHPGSGRRCRDCGHCYAKTFSSTFFKCDLVPDTGGKGSDTRATWPACVRWTPIETPQEKP
jgi:hypothetical protein